MCLLEKCCRNRESCDDREEVEHSCGQCDNLRDHEEPLTLLRYDRFSTAVSIFSQGTWIGLEENSYKRTPTDELMSFAVAVKDPQINYAFLPVLI